MKTVYTITSKADGRVYVGCTQSIKRRSEYHFRRLSIRKHNNAELQRNYDYFGKDNLIIEPLVEIEDQFAASEEHYWATILNSHYPNGLNVRPTNPNKFDGRLASQTKDKLSISRTGFRHTPETLARMSEVKKGKPCHPNTRQAVIDNPNRYVFTGEDLAKANASKVAQLTLDGQFVAEFPSIRAAAKANNIPPLRISSYLRGKVKEPKQFKWQYL